MVKSKKKAPPAKPVEEMETEESAAESVEDEEPFYDSMIENGTSDESNDEADAEENEDDDDDDDDEEESDDDGFSDKEEASPSPTVTKRKQSAEENGTIHKKYKPDQNTELFKQPTVEELNHLNETKNLFHSNLFRMQVEETLRELKVKDKHKKFINTWLESFTAFVKKLKSEKAKTDADNLPWLKSSGIQLPLDLKAIVQKGVQFQFIKPADDPYFIGSYKQEAVIGSKMVVDVCVTMPDECFQKEDYLNLVYERKRALYLAYLAAKMRVVQPFNEFEYKFAYCNNNPLKPVIELSPSGKMGNKLTLRIFAVAAESSFKLNRFVPWNSNIRETLFGEKNAKDKLPLATPNYNANVLFDLTLKRNQDMLEQALTSNKSLREGLILLKVWLKQRNFNVGYTGFGNHIMAAFVVYLFKQRKLNAAMSSYQVARHVWNHLALSTWDEDGKGITLCSSSSAANQPTLEQFSTHFDVVFVDSTGFCNICANLSVDLYRRIRSEAKRAVDILNNMKVNSFQLIFMESCPVYTQFDHIFKFSGDATISKILKTHGTDADRHNFAGFWFPQVLKMVSNILRKGLSDRILHLGPIETVCPSWQVDSPATEVEKTFRLGIILNPERAYEILDKGPQANEDTAESFRKFWGDKSELRRFQDGSITEACVWAATGESFAQKRLIVQRIVLHLLKHHFDVDQVKYIAGELDEAYKLNRIFKVDRVLANVNQETDAETTALEVIKSFDDLGQKLRTLDDLPLDISGIQGTSPVFRYADPIPILPDGRPTKLGLVSRAVCQGVIQLGVSGKWPNDLTALRALKTAFYVKIADGLKEKHKLRTLLRFDGVFVLKDGFVFQVEIAHAKEIGLLKKEVTDKGITQYRDSPESIALEKRHVLLPKVTSSLHGLYQLHPGLGPTIMIAKRWLYSQLIDDGLWPDECTELLIASQFMKMGAQASTCQPQTGFFRFLHLLANTDWRTELTLLNFNEDMDDATRSKIENSFNNERDSFPPLMIVTSHDDKHYGIWSQEAPIAPVLARVVLLAKHALSVVEQSVLHPLTVVKPSKLFTASPEGYDLLIRLNPEYAPNCMANEFPSGFSQWGKPNFRQFPAAQNLLKCAITELREAFSEFCIFFYNPCGGKEIAVIWTPNAFVKREFTITALNGCCLTADEKEVICNKDALIEDIKIILKDMFVSIEETNK